ncbi:hypothetical protein RclHR1_34630001 [Rhizophagus clarus]|uniref:Reverse transcriptase domain-containing protein n=1 Tax=Rhizophagus clarus TaxID=94130 RepID=A0A2Z6RAX0_9GLOM|nr:hypothetical protein RclHR1_34630001 [Rhizophagus clarus]
MLQLYQQLYKDQKTKWSTDRINYFIERRNSDLSNNQNRMLNSLLNRKPRHITLDRLIYTPEGSDTPVYTTKAQTIAEQARLHFQTHAGSTSSAVYNSVEDLPEPWKQEYLPIPYIDANWWSTFDSPITMDELLNTLKTLPNNKAPGPSGITYEDIKHLHPSILLKLTTFFNLCLRHITLPKAWKQALIFPIPKPYEWEYLLSNTRPITLLETPQKILYSIITQRLNNILSKHNLLQHNNRAGLKGQSTYEPLVNIQYAIESVNFNNQYKRSSRNKQDLWIAIQDLSKAYDRVDIRLLRLSLLRLKIPQAITDFICQTFSDRFNQVILPN